VKKVRRDKKRKKRKKERQNAMIGEKEMGKERDRSKE